MTMDSPKFPTITRTLMAVLSLSAPSPSTAAASATALQPSSTGPHVPKTTTSSLLPSHKIYQPSSLPRNNDTLPVIVWGSDACSSTGDAYQHLNEELASWGAVVFACGSPAPVLSLLESRTGAPAWGHLDAAKVGMLGTSCAGSALYTAAENPLVLSLAVLDAAAARSSSETRDLVANATKPVFWFVAGEAGEKGVKADFETVAKGIPAWLGGLPGANAEVMDEGGAGKMGRAGRFWAQWMVAGNQTASEFFVDAAGAESEGWSVARKGLDVLVL